jgi:hypothetical protein
MTLEPDKHETMAATAARAKLEGHMDGYLAALARNDPTELPVAADVICIEQNQPLALGEGSWRTLSGLGVYRHYYTDIVTSRCGFIGTVFENGVPALLDVLLEIEGDCIRAVETYLIRDPIGGRRLNDQGTPEAAWLELVPQEKRAPRARLTALVDRYFQSLQRNDGKGDYSFFDKECNRYDHGLQTTNVKTPATYGHSDDTTFMSLSAEEQWKTGFLGFVTEIRDRRYVVVDEERQTVLAFAMFDHNGTVRSINLSSGSVFVLSPYFDVPRTLQIIEGFRIRDDKLFRIEATMTEVPYGSRHP